MNPEMPEIFIVFFPSLSRDILWKARAVSRVRFAAQTPRALDTAPTFHQILLRRKRREGVAIGQPVTPALAPTAFYTLGIHYPNQRMAAPRALD